MLIFCAWSSVVWFTVKINVVQGNSIAKYAETWPVNHTTLSVTRKAIMAVTTYDGGPD